MPDRSSHGGMTTGDMASQDPAVQFCPHCSKPFTLASSLKRHSAYCSRRRSHPSNRPRSCRACSAAKAKCSFQTPCSRCISRGVECVYDGPLSSKTDNTTATATMLSDLSVPADRVVSSISKESDPSLNADFLALDPYDQEMYNYWQGVIDDMIAEPPNDIPLAFHSLEQSMPTQSLTVHNSVTDRLPATDDMKSLTRLRKNDPTLTRSANLVIDALCAIPEQMLRRATLPPFIHPHWHRAAMPEPLAVCMRIAQLFAARTPEIKPFLWRTILSEQRRVVEQAPLMSKEDLLAAIQAHVVYITMRIVDGIKDSPEWNAEMATLHMTVCERFLNLCEGKFSESAQTNPSLTWDDWVFAESRRRTSCVWFLFTRTVSVKTVHGCPPSERPWELPLPSPKMQWEARTEEIWREEMDSGIPTVDTFGSLIESKEQCHESHHAQRLDAWNARTDNLGSLLNVAMLMV